MRSFLVRLVINAIALWIAIRLVPGITYEGDVVGLLGLALIFGIVNAVIRPLISILTCPLIVLTLGLFTLVINGLMLWLAGAIGGSLGINVNVAGFWPAFWGGIVVGIVSIVLSLFIREESNDHQPTIKFG